MNTNQENHPYHISTFSGRANHDSDPELVFSQPGNGMFIISRNARPLSNDGNTGSIEKIKGEEIKYQNTTSAIGYRCIGSESVNENIVEFWAPINPSFPGIIRVNGVIVLESTDFELRVDYPLQWDKNPASEFSEIAITDNRVPPYIFNIDDLVASLTATPNKYFSNFNPLLYQVNLQSPLDTLVFKEMINVGGGGGLPTGQYQYQMRYASEAGDRTQWSHPTPLIPVGQSLNSDSDQYPWVKTFGGPPAPQSLTAFAPKLQFRVTNIYNYDYIEIKRIPYNAGAGIEFSPNGTIVAKIDVNPGEISIREYIDPSESNVNTVLSAVNETQELAEVETAKTVRYFDRRLVLMNVKLVSKESELEFLDVNDKQGWPVIDKLYKAGYNDPYNHTYKRKYMNGEKYGFGVNLYDGVGTKAFAQKIPQLKNYQFPNRRDTISAETSNYSFGGTVYAADTSASNAVTQTHEVFDHYNPIAKSNYCDFKNIVEKGRVFGATGTKVTSPYGVKQDCDETNEEIENHNANVNLSLVSVAYQPFTPVRQTDPDVTGHNYVVNTKVSKDNFAAPVENSDVTNYRPNAMSPDYYAMGMMIAGFDNFPKWAKSFAVVRTEAAKRVLCQGLAYYKLTKGKFKLIADETLGGKSTNTFWYYSPDVEQGIVPSDTVNDIIDNPQNYKLQFVSPLGFFSEWYSAEDKLSATQPANDRCIDMISYVRLLRDGNDPGTPSSQINPFEDANMGVPGGGGFNYVTYDKYRNINQLPTAFSGSPDKGNRLFDIRSIKRVADGRGTYLEVESDGDVYGASNVGGNSESQFDDDGLKDWTEPIYIMNIIRVGADIRDKSTQEYKQTTHYQKLESIIGKSTGLANQKFPLVDERWEDCIPAPTSSDYGASTDRFVYVQLTDGTVQQWINVTYKTVAQKSTIIANIVAQTSPYSGVYTHVNIDGYGRFFELQFNEPGYYPETDSFILVRYDNTAPIRVFGGDTYIGETIFAPLDRQASARDDAAETQFAFGIGLPYKKFKINPRYYTIRKAGAALNAIQDKEWFSLGFIRQLCIMFTVESRACCHLAYNSEYPKQYFPLINYVIRPNRWDIDKNTVDNHIYDAYVDDYTENERTQWKWGGFRFLQQVNPDYSTEPKNAFFSKPEFGFIEKRQFSTRVMWSLPRAINAQDSPGLKTFPANNSFDIDDDQGEIKYSWDATSDRGENLYAFCNTGICLLVTNKSILSDLSAGELGYMAADSFVKQQYWLNKEIGMFDEFWRGRAEAFVSVGEEGSESTIEAIFFPTKESVFRFMNNEAKDVGRVNFHNKVYKEGIQKVLPGFQTHVTGIFNKYYQEYWLHIKNSEEDPDVNDTFVFGQKNGGWYGTNDFKFDLFTIRHNEVFGHRNLETFELNKGYVINDQPVIFEVLTAAAPEQFWTKEFIRIRVNSPNGQKPTRIEFYKDRSLIVQSLIDVSTGPLYMKNYNGYEALIGRTLSSVNINRPRLQGRIVFYKIIHNLASEFKVIDSSIQFKKIK